MNRQQKKAARLLGLAGAGAVALVVLVAAHTADVNSKVGDLVDVLVLEADVARHETVGADVVAVRQVPERWAPPERYSSPDDVEGLLAAGPLAEGSFLQPGMLVASPKIGPRQSKIAIGVSADSVATAGVADGSLVAIYGAFDPEQPEGRPCVALLVPAARVVEVGEPGGSGDAGVVSVGFVVNNGFARRVVHAASFARQVRLAVVPPGTSNEWPEPSSCGPGPAPDDDPKPRDKARAHAKGKDARPRGNRSGRAGRG